MLLVLELLASREGALRGFCPVNRAAARSLRNQSWDLIVKLQHCQCTLRVFLFGMIFIQLQIGLQLLSSWDRRRTETRQKTKGSGFGRNKFGISTSLSVQPSNVMVKTNIIGPTPFGGYQSAILYGVETDERISVRNVLRSQLK